MNPEQQQILDQFYGHIRQAQDYVKQLLTHSDAGCQQMIAQNPTDAIPLSNALGAIEHQVKDVGRKTDDYWSQCYDAICERGSGEPAYSYGKRANRGFQTWIDHTWQRFDNHQRYVHTAAMWPLVQEALKKAASCPQCGAPIQRQHPERAESLTCNACRAVNQVLPEAAVAIYYASIPHVFAERESMDKRFAEDLLKDEWEAHRDAEYAARQERPDETIDYLRKREALQKDYWETYAAAKTKYEGGTPEDAKSLVDARMKFFYDDMNRNEVWRAANGMGDIVVKIPPHLENVDEWGPLRNDQWEENQVHESMLSEAISDPPRYTKLLAKLGYREPLHRALVQRTFNRYAEHYMNSNPDYHEKIGKAAMRAMTERTRMAAEEMSGEGGALAPIEGITIIQCGEIYAKQANQSPDDFLKTLAQLGLDREKWDRVSKQWLDRMSKDTTGAIATEYSKGFMGAGQGKFGAAGQAAGAAMEQGGWGQQAAAGAEPVPFETYAEISGAMAAWSKQGKDISAGLHKHFQMTAQDVSSISMFWSSKMMQDMSSFDRLSKLTAQFEQKWMAIA
ncbi:hypothetical protein BH09MYX1_BH09MYX1_03670 [soil metagenome]